MFADDLQTAQLIKQSRSIEADMLHLVSTINQNGIDDCILPPSMSASIELGFIHVHYEIDDCVDLLYMNILCNVLRCSSVKVTRYKNNNSLDIKYRYSYNAPQCDNIPENVLSEVERIKQFVMGINNVGIGSMFGDPFLSELTFKDYVWSLRYDFKLDYTMTARKLLIDHLKELEFKVIRHNKYASLTISWYYGYLSWN